MSIRARLYETIAKLPDRDPVARIVATGEFLDSLPTDEAEVAARRPPRHESGGNKPNAAATLAKILFMQSILSAPQSPVNVAFPPLADVPDVR